MEALLEHGVESDLKDNMGKTALDLSCHNNTTRMIRRYNESKSYLPVLK